MIDSKIGSSGSDVTNIKLLKKHNGIETSKENVFEKLNCFRRCSILKCVYVSKNSNNMAGNSKNIA